MIKSPDISVMIPVMLLAMVSILVTGCGSPSRPIPEKVIAKAGQTAPEATVVNRPDLLVAPSNATIPSPPKRVYPEFTSLNGLNGAGVTEMLGSPSLKRSDAPAEIWQYRSASCAVNLFLYQVSGSTALEVTHVETVMLGDRQQLDDQGCFISVIDALG